jgi:hypothetical protein
MRPHDPLAHCDQRRAIAIVCVDARSCALDPRVCAPRARVAHRHRSTHDPVTFFVTVTPEQ